MLGFGRSKEVSKVVSLNSLRVPKKSGLTRASLVATLILLSSSFGSNKKSFAEDQPASPVPVNPSAEFLKVHQYDALMHVARNHPEAGHFLAKVNERYEQYTERMKIWGNLPVEQRAREGDIEHPKTRFRNGIRSDSISVIKARLERANQSVNEPISKDFAKLLIRSKKLSLKMLGILAHIPLTGDNVEKINERTRKFNDLYPRDPAKLENAARQFTMNLEGNSALGELVKDDFKVIFGFDLDATQLEINSAYPELANADLQSVSSNSRMIKEFSGQLEEIQKKINSQQGDIADLKKQEATLTQSIQTLQQDVYASLVSNISNSYLKLLASIEELNEDQTESVLEFIEKIRNSEKVEGKAKISEQDIRNMQAWSNALVDVASLFMDPKDAGTVGAILDVGVAIAMVYAGDPGARVQNAAYLVSTVTKLVGVTLIKKGPSAQEQMQKALEEIYKSVENLRQEMHKRFNEMHQRFDRLESFLQGVNNRIDTVITQNFFIEKEILKLQLGINNLGILLALVERKLDFYDLAEWRREKDNIASLFKKSYEEASGMFGEFESGPTASYIDVRGHQIDCLTVFREHAVSTARRDLFTAQDMVGKETDLFSLFLALNRRGYESSHAILKAAIDTGGILNIQASAFPFNVSNLVSSNPLEFARGALAAVEIPELFWDKNGIFVDKEIQKKTLARIRDEAARIQKYSRAFVIPQVLEAATALYQEQYDAFWKLVESNLNNTQSSISVPREVLFLNGEAELDPLPNWPVDKRESVSDKLNLDYAGRLKDKLKSTRASIISSLFSRYKSQGSDSYNPFYPGHYRPDFHDMILPSANQRLAVPVRAALFHPEIRQAVAFESGPQATALPPHWIKQFGSSNPNCYIVPRGNSDDYLKIGEKETFVGDARFWFATLRSPITYHQDIQYGRMVARVIVTTEPQGFIRTTHTEPFPEDARHLIYNPDGSLKTTDEAELQRVLKADFIRVNSKVIGKEAAIAEFDRLYKKYCDPNEESKTRIFDFYTVVQDAPSNWENYYKHETSEVAAWVNHLIVNLQQNEGENSLKDKEILGYEIRLEDGKPVTFTLEVCEDEKIDLLAYAQAAVSSDSNLDYPSKGEKTEEELKLAWDRFARDIVMKAEADPTNAGIGPEYDRYFYPDSQYNKTPPRIISYQYSLDEEAKLKTFEITISRPKKQDFIDAAIDYFDHNGGKIFPDISKVKDPNLNVKVVLEYMPKDSYWPEWIKDLQRLDISQTPYEEIFADEQRAALSLILAQLQNPNKGEIFQALQNLESARILLEALVSQGAGVLAAKNNKLSEAFLGLNNIPSATDLIYSLKFGEATRERYPDLRRRLRLRVETALRNLREGSKLLQEQIEQDKEGRSLGHPEVVRARELIEDRIKELEK